ncbi:MAG: hypothetical protein ACOH5I_26150 [Oligoflexus sp.]
MKFGVIGEGGGGPSRISRNGGINVIKNTGSQSGGGNMISKDNGGVINSLDSSGGGVMMLGQDTDIGSLGGCTTGGGTMKLGQASGSGTMAVNGESTASTSAA